MTTESNPTSGETVEELKKQLAECRARCEHLSAEVTELKRVHGIPEYPPFKRVDFDEST